MGAMTIATLLLFLGATGKSAQIPLYTWLPDAMEGPTPVSALIHAATMVTAGVYMIGRNAVLFEHAPITLAVVAAIGVATALMAGTIGLVQNDIKRVLAYSTVSQLGYMFLAMGVGAYAAGIFHLYTHAFFKALLFLGSGAVIHALAGEQDIRNMGGLRKALPITYWTFLIGAIAIAGVPPLAGFFSKDEILWKTFASGHRIMWIIGLVTSFLTATYMFRLVFLTFHGERRHDARCLCGLRSLRAGPRTSDLGRRQPWPFGSRAMRTTCTTRPPPMALALIVLAIGSVVAGFVGIPHALGGHNQIEAFLHPAFEAHAVAPINEFQVVEPGRPAPAETAAAGHAPAAADEQMELVLMGVSTGLALAGIGLAWFFWVAQPQGRGRRRAQRHADLHAAPEQVLRGRNLRRRRRAADQEAVNGGVVEGGRRRADRRHGERRRQRRPRQQRRAAPPAVRLDPRVRGVAVSGSGADSGVVFAAVMSDVRAIRGLDARRIGLEGGLRTSDFGRRTSITDKRRCC